MNLNPLMSSVRMDWNTPPEILALLHAGWPEGIALDPCSNPASIVEAGKAWTKEDDGLGRDWFAETPGRLVYCNPPYGRELSVWASEFRRQEQRRKERLKTPSGSIAASSLAMIALVPARTDTAWFREAVYLAHAVVFLAGRVRFLGAKAGAPFPSALIYYGSKTSAWGNFARACSLKGAWIVEVPKEDHGFLHG